MLEPCEVAVFCLCVLLSGTVSCCLGVNLDLTEKRFNPPTALVLHAPQPLPASRTSPAWVGRSSRPAPPSPPTYSPMKLHRTMPP